MHNQYAKDGLAVVTVSLDPIDDDDAKENDKTKARVLEFLRKQGATNTNLLLNESTEFYQEALRFNAPPCLYVFDRQGKWTKIVPDKGPIDHKEVERLVVKLLKEKS